MGGKKLDDDQQKYYRNQDVLNNNKQISNIADRKNKSQFNDRSILKEKLDNQDNIHGNMYKKSGYYGMNFEEKNYGQFNIGNINHNSNNSLINSNSRESKEITIIKNDDDSMDENFNEIKMFMKSVFDI